jgi:hypothetical protein
MTNSPASNLQETGAIPKAGLVNAELVEHADKKVGHWRMNWRHDMPIPLQLT